MPELEEIQIGQFEEMRSTLEKILTELRRERDNGGVAALKRVYWDPAAPDPTHDLTAEYDHDGSFAAIGIFNLSGGVISVAFTPSGSRVAGNATLTLSARGWIVLPYRGTTVSVSGAAAGSALLVAFSTPQPADAGTF